MLKQKLELETPKNRGRARSLGEIIEQIFETEKNSLSEKKFKAKLIEIQTLFKVKEKESKVFLSGSNTQKERKISWIIDNKEIQEEWKKELNFNASHYLRIVVKGSIWLEKLNWLRDNREIWKEWKEELEFNASHYAAIVSGAGWLEKLNWLRDNREIWEEWKKGLNFNMSYYSRIVSGSKWLEKLNWIRDNRETWEEWKKEVNFNASHYSKIVRGKGWLEKLNWLRDNSKMWGEWKKRNTTGDILEILTDETEYLTEKIENSLAKIEETGNEVEGEQEKYLWEKKKTKEKVIEYIRKKNYWEVDGFSDSLLEGTYPMLYVAQVVCTKSLKQLIERKGVNDGDRLLFKKFEDWFGEKREINYQKARYSIQEFFEENPKIKVDKNENLTFIIKKNLIEFIEDNVSADMKNPVKILTDSPGEHFFFEKMSRHLNYNVLSSENLIFKSNSMDFLVTNENILTSEKELINSILDKINNINFYVVSKDIFISKRNFDSIKERGKEKDVRLSYFGSFNLFAKYNITRGTFEDNQNIYKISING